MNQYWNTLKTAAFLGLLTGFFVLIGAALGGRTGMILAWWFSDSIALRLSRARKVSPEEAPELHTMTRVLAERAGIPMPALYVIDSDSPNAFATGRSPARGAVAVTTGIQRMLTREELAGVVAHEIAHIKHRDTLISSVAATIAGAIGVLADMAIWGAIFGGGDEEEDGGGGGLVALFLAPIAALLIQLAISRSREFAADARGATLLGNPLPLASALEKLEAGARRSPMEVRPATAHLYIVNPAMGGLAGLFRTHPETAKRVAALKAMAVQPHNTPALQSA